MALDIALYPMIIVHYIPLMITTAVHISICSKHKQHLSQLLISFDKHQYMDIYHKFKNEYHDLLDNSMKSFLISLLSNAWWIFGVYLPRFDTIKVFESLQWIIFPILYLVPAAHLNRCFTQLEDQLWIQFIMEEDDQNGSDIDADTVEMRKVNRSCLRCIERYPIAIKFGTVMITGGNIVKFICFFFITRYVIYNIGILLQN